MQKLTKTKIFADIGHNWVGSGNEISAKRGTELLQIASRSGVDGAIIHLFSSHEVFRDLEVAKANERFNMGDNIFDTLVDSARYYNLDVYVAVHYPSAIDIVKLDKVKGFYLPNGVLYHDDVIKKLSPIVNSGKPIAIETGIFNIDELEYPLKLFDSDMTILLHSSGVYPTPSKDLRLNLIGDLMTQIDPDFEHAYRFGFSSTAEIKEMDFAALLFNLDMFVRKIDIGDGKGIESRWSAEEEHFKNLVVFSNEIYDATHPVYEYQDMNLTKNDVSNRNRWKVDPDDLKTPCRCGNA